MSRSISAQEVASHNTWKDLWIVIDGIVWDLTDFAPEHPGGSAIILRHAGRDATEIYSEVHAPSIISGGLPASKRLGTLDTASIDSAWAKSPPTISTALKPNEKPNLDTLISAHDFETVASHTLKPKTWAFYSSAATDLITKKRNNTAYNDITFRPRVMRDVHASKLNTSTSMLGQKLDVPIYCSPAAMHKLVHPEGEKAMGRACKSRGIPQTVSTQASFPIEEIFAATTAGPYGALTDQDRDGELPIFFQLYVDKERSKSEVLLEKIEKLGAKAVFVTVDAATAGKRESDERLKADEGLAVPMSGAQATNDSKGGSLGRVMAGFIDARLCWADIAWLRARTKLPIVLKGIMTALDAKMAMEYGCDGIVLSNHGGRNLDTTPPPVLVLLEIQKGCPEVFDHLEVYVDGGIQRGTDIFKALCLGAKACGLGRGFLYALNYGQEGVEKYIDILRDELETTMRLCGITDISEAHPGLLNTGAVDHLIPDMSEGHPYAKWRPKARI